MRCLFLQPEAVGRRQPESKNTQAAKESAIEVNTRASDPAGFEEAELTATGGDRFVLSGTTQTPKVKFQKK